MLEQRLELYETSLLPWDIEMTVEEPVYLKHVVSRIPQPFQSITGKKILKKHIFL